MLKHLTLTFCAIALLPACVLGGGSTESDSNSNSNSDSNADTTGNGTTTEAPTTANPTTGTTGTTGQTTTGTTGEEPTTGQTTTGTTGEAPTTGQTSTTDTTSEQTAGTSGTDSDTDTGGALYGNCGWAEIGYYACGPEGEPGVEDPMMTDPIACPDGIAAGDACDDEMGPVGSVGCCSPEGMLYYCDVDGKKTVFEQDCSE